MFLLGICDLYYINFSGMIEPSGCLNCLGLTCLAKKLPPECCWVQFSSLHFVPSEFVCIACLSALLKATNRPSCCSVLTLVDSQSVQVAGVRVWTAQVLAPPLCRNRQGRGGLLAGSAGLGSGMKTLHSLSVLLDLPPPTDCRSPRADMFSLLVVLEIAPLKPDY